MKSGDSSIMHYWVYWSADLDRLVAEALRHLN